MEKSPAGTGESRGGARAEGGFPRLRQGAPGDPSDYDAITELFLGEDAPTLSLAGDSEPMEIDGSTRAAGNRPRPVVEALIVGNTPALGRIWATAYARHLASQAGLATGMIRQDAHETGVELIGPAMGITPNPDETLEACIQRCDRAVGTWLLYPDELGQAELAGSPAVDRLTVLSGVDEPAIVGAYRTLKSLAQVGGGAPAIRLVLVGGSAGQSAEGASARARVERAAATFLDRPVETVALPGKIGVGPRVAMHVSGATSVSRVLSALGPDRAPTPHAPVAAEAPRSRRSLATLIGLVPLEARCPFAPAAELSADSAGRLHVVAMDESGGPDRCFLELARAGAWGSLNISVLRLTPGGHVLVDGVTPELHLITRDPRTVAHVRGAGVRLHVIVDAASPRCLDLD